MKKKKVNIFLLSLVLLGVTVGFAALSTTLKVSGTTNIGKNTWNIYWDNVANQSGVTTTTPVISNDATNGPNTVVTWTVTLDQPGDFYEFTVDAVNAGTLDAMITSIEHKLNGSAISNNNKLPDYVHYSVTYANGDAIALNQLLPKATVSGNTTVFTRETYKVRVEFDSNIDPSDLSNENESYELSFGVTYGQADGNAVNPHPIFTMPQGKNKDNLAVGDEVCISGTTTECFNVVSYNANDVVLLAKYNLNVGNNTQTGTIGIQNSLATGDNGDSSTQVDDKYPATVYFSDTMYWNSGGLKAKYGDSYPGNVYDADYTGDPGSETYSIAKYVEAYKTILEGNGYGATIKEIRLLKDSEAVDPSIGCSHDTYNCPAGSFILNTSFWLQTAGYYGYDSRDMLTIIRSWNYYNTSMYASNMDGVYGVRPVIVVEKSNM